MRMSAFTQQSAPNRHGVFATELKNYELPSFSGVVLSALETLRDPTATAESASEILAADPGVSVKLLALANSACFGLSRPVQSVAHAISLLGQTQVEAMLLSVAVSGVLPRSPIPQLKASQFWRAAARRAVLARSLARLIDRDHIHETFTASLLQDMAIPLFAQLKSAEYGEVLEQWRSEQLDLAELERQRFGWDHAMMGAWMCERWRFSDSLLRTIGAHHGLWAETELPAVTLVSCLTDAAGDDYGQAQFVQNVCDRYSLPEQDVADLIAHSAVEAAELSSLFV